MENLGSTVHNIIIIKLMLIENKVKGSVCKNSAIDKIEIHLESFAGIWNLGIKLFPRVGNTYI